MATDIWSWSTTPINNGTADASIPIPEGMNAAAVNDAMRQIMGRIREYLNDQGGVSSSSGTNTVSVTTTSGFTALSNGLVVVFKAGGTNTGAATLSVNGLTSKSILKVTTAGETALTAGEITTGGIYTVVYVASAASSAGAWILLDPSWSAELSLINKTSSSIASATTTDLSAASGDVITITGTTTITGLGTVTGGAERTLIFAGALVLTHNATSLILPGGANITTAANDVAKVVSLGSGNWRCIAYTKANGQPVGIVPITLGGTGATTAVAGFDALHSKGSDIVSTSSIDLAAATGDYVRITGTTSISSLGTCPGGVARKLLFAGSLTLVNSASMVLITGADITTAANDIAGFVSDGGGNWRMEYYTRANGTALTGTVPVASGGTGATTADTARQNLFAAAASVQQGIMRNPAFKTSQFFASVSQASFTNNYIADTIKIDKNIATVIAAQRADVTLSTSGLIGARQAIRTTISSGAPSSFAAGEFIAPYKAFIEGVDIASLAWGSADAVPLNFVFGLKSPVSGAVSVAFLNGAGNRCYVTTVTATAGVYQMFNVVVPGDTTGTWATDTSIALYVYIGCISGSTYITSTLGSWQAGAFVTANTAVNWAATNANAFDVVFADLFPGEIGMASGSISATNMTRIIANTKSVDQSLALCQRYYETTVPLGTVPADGCGFAGALISPNLPIGAAPSAFWQFRERKRAAPTITLYNPRGAGTAGQWDSSSVSLASAAASNITEDSARITSGVIASAGAYYIHAKADARL